MKIGIIPCSSAPRGLKILFGCLMLCLLTFMPAAAQDENTTTGVDAAQDENLTWIGGDLYDYAELSFAVPKEVEEIVEAESLEEGNYSQGRYVLASLLFNQSRVFVLLLYPCDPPLGELDALGLKAAAESFDSGLNRTVYSPDPYFIGDRPAIWGMIENQALVVYQPSNLTTSVISVIYIDGNVTEDVVVYFPDSLRIVLNESSSPLWPGYCEGLETGEAGSIEAANQTEEVAAPVEAVVNETGPAEVAEQAVSEAEEVAETEQAVSEAEEVAETEQAVNQTGPGPSAEDTQAVLGDVKSQLEEKFGRKFP